VCRFGTNHTLDGADCARQPEPGARSHKPLWRCSAFTARPTLMQAQLRNRCLARQQAPDRIDFATRSLRSSHFLGHDRAPSVFNSHTHDAYQTPYLRSAQNVAWLLAHNAMQEFPRWERRNSFSVRCHHAHVLDPRLRRYSPREVWRGHSCPRAPQKSDWRATRPLRSVTSASDWCLR